jgi:hypothetical protein
MFVNTTTERSSSDNRTNKRGLYMFLFKLRECINNGRARTLNKNYNIMCSYVLQDVVNWK